MKILQYLKTNVELIRKKIIPWRDLIENIHISILLLQEKFFMIKRNSDIFGNLNFLKKISF